MDKIITLLPILVFCVQPTFADSWARPREKDYFSENKAFVAHVTPAIKETKAKLDVYKLKDAERTLMWHCALGNEGAPGFVFLSDDGRNVATVNENNDRVHGGMGDYVLAFYDSSGLVKNYSLEQILHYPDKIDKQQFYELVSRSVSGRNWGSMPLFFDRRGKELHFCVWLYRGHRWLAWDATTGVELHVTEDLISRWNEKGRQWARAAATGPYWFAAVSFLGRLKNPSDRPVIESLLADEKFYTTRGDNLPCYCSYNTRRSLADQILATWDGKYTAPPPSPRISTKQYYYLGTVEGSVELPYGPKPGDHWLCVYLIPTDVPQDKWCEKLPAHRLAIYFGSYPWCSDAFQIQGVTPGEYYVKAVWDRAEPYNFEDHYLTGPPQPGDFQSIESPHIIVTAGETTQIGIVYCTHKVTDATD